MEKIFIKDVTGAGWEKTLLSHAILTCCTNKVIARIKGDSKKPPEEDERYIEVVFKMNGITVSLSKFLNNLDSQLDRMINEKARDIVLAKLNDATNAINGMEEEATNAIKRIVKERLGIALPEEW